VAYTLYPIKNNEIPNHKIYGKNKTWTVSFVLFFCINADHKKTHYLDTMWSNKLETLEMVKSQ
jgi:hypothetical protein